MFKTGEYFIYSTQGVCHIDQVGDYEINGTDRKCYVFHPVNDKKSKITTPVDNQRVIMRQLIVKDEAEDIMRSFEKDNENDFVWDMNKRIRYKTFFDAVNTCNARLYAGLLKLLLIKKEEIKSSGKKFSMEDERFLTSVKTSLSEELALVLGRDTDSILSSIDRKIRNLTGLLA